MCGLTSGMPMARRAFSCALAASFAIGLSASSAALAACSSGLTTFTSTGAEQCYTVPAGITALHVVAIGAGGGGSLGGAGGLGARVTSEITVTPGQTLYVEVGLGGGTPGSSAGGGGGASDVQTCSTGSGMCVDTGLSGTDPRLVVGGGGGGTGGGGGAGSGGNAGAGPAVTCQAGAGGGGGAGGSGGGGAGGGTCSAGGTGGNGGAGGGLTGSPGTPSAGGSANGTGPFGGAGGGAGYWGGGAGGGSGSGSGSGGGGGGGSSFGPTGSVLTAAASATPPSVTLEPVSPTLIVGAPGRVTFPTTQPLQTVSPPQTVTITDIGFMPLSISGLTFVGTNPGDYFIGSNGCLGAISTAASCSLTVHFAPQAAGASSATLQIASNDPNGPASVTLSGTGGQLPQGPPGTNGTNGARGPQGPAGKVELVTCKTVTKKKAGKKVTKRKCTTKVVTGPVKFTTGGVRERASISRRHAVFATGTAVRAGSGRWRLVLSDLRPLRAGRYTLTLTSHHRTRRFQVTIA